VDPCLGFYSGHRDVSDTVHYTKLDGSSRLQANPIIDHSPNISSSPKKTLAPPTPLLSVPRLPTDAKPKSAPQDYAPNSDSTVVTVEEFLKRSAERPTRNYGRKKRRVVDLGNSDIVPDQEWHESEAGDLQPKKRRKHRCYSDSRSSSASAYSPSPECRINGNETRLPRTCNKKVKSSLASRLIRAAVLSHAEPVDSLMHQSNTASKSRRPLQFLSETRGFSPTKRRMWTLVDPRKFAPFSQPSFLPRNRKNITPVTPVNYHPLTRWRTSCDEPPHEEPPRKKIKTQALAQKNILIDCRPLLFIPVRDAEELYERKMSSAK